MQCYSISEKCWKFIASRMLEIKSRHLTWVTPKSRIYIYTLNVKSKCQGTTQPYWKSDLKSPKVQFYIVQKWMHHVHFPSNQIIFFLLLAKGTTKGSALLITFLCYPSHFLLNFWKKIFWKDLDNNSPIIDNRSRLYLKFK